MTEIKFKCSITSVVSNITFNILKKIGDKLEIPTIYITSTIRPPKVQAEAMYENCLNKKYISYLEAGAVTQERCKKGIKEKESKQDTIKAMVKLIEEFAQKGKRVSKHCVSEEIYRQCNIIDISYKSMPSIRKAMEFIEECTNYKEIVKIIQPLVSDVQKYDKSEPAIHLEIKQ